MTTYSFTINKNNVLVPDAYGNGSVVFTVDQLPIPITDLAGLPQNLFGLINLVGPTNIKMAYYARAYGTVSSHACFATHTLYGFAGLSDTQGKISTQTPNTGLASTSNNFDAGGYVDSGWQSLQYNGPLMISSFTSSDGCVGSCDPVFCQFATLGGWKQMQISLRIDVTVTLLNYCLTPNQYNINSDLCYNYMSDYLNSGKNPPTQEITDYLKNYCATKFPNKGLEIFNDESIIGVKDYNICACNMDDKYYNQFIQSLKGQFPAMNLGSIRPACLLPECVNSKFKNNQLDGCPIPQCFEVVNISNSGISGNVNINQNSNCATYGIPAGTNPTPTFWDTYKVYIIIGIFLLVVIIAFIIYFVFIDDDDDNGMSETSETSELNNYND